MQVVDDAGRGADLDLRHYLHVIGRRKWMIAVVAVLVGLAAMGFAFTKEDRYRASGDLLLLAPGEVEAVAEGLSDDTERIIANEVEILESKEMRDAVAEELGDGYLPVSASATGENDVITLTAESTEAQAAADAVNAYARTYERLRRQRTVAALREEVRDLQEQRRNEVAALADINAPIDDLDQQIAATPPGPAQDALIAQRDAVLNSTAAARESTLASISQIDTDIENAQQAMRNPSGGVNYLNPATEPSEPFYPQPKKDLFVGLAVGLLLGLAVAFLWEQLDDTVRGRADADRATGGLPVIGLVPQIPGWRRGGETRLVTLDEPHSSAAEAYRGLLTSIEFLTESSGAKVLLLTSPGASEGKTTTVANVGVALADAGHRTVLVDGDLRRPRLHRFFGIENTVGLTTVLGDRIDVATAVVDVDAPKLLHVVPAGPPAPNPAELLRNPVTEAAIQKLAESFDVVIIDSPPVLPVADALVLARHVDSTIIVAAAGSTSRRKLARAIEALRQVEAPVHSLVLNGVGAAEGDEYGYYGDGYGASSHRKRRLGRRRRT